MINKNWIWYFIAIVSIILLLKDCGGEKIKTVTVTEIVKVTDTVTNTVIQEVPKTVYIERLKTIKGKDTIIYKDKADSTTIKANQYATKLESNNATANLQITTTGELLDVQGVITFEQENKTTTITKTKNASGLFLYGQTNLNGFDSYGVGIDYQIKNKIIVGTSVNYDNFNGHFSLNAKIGFKL